MTPYFRKIVWLPTFLALGAMIAILGSAIRGRAWRLLTIECLLAAVLIAVIVWLLQALRRGHPAQPYAYEAAILCLLFVVVAAGAAQVVFRR